LDEAFANEATDYTAARSRPPSTAAVFGLAELSSQSAHGGVSTFRKVRRYSQEAPNQPSRSSPPILATAPKSSQPAGQTFQQAIQVQTLAPCPSQDWPRHRPHKLANIRQDPAFGSSLAHNVAWKAAGNCRPFSQKAPRLISAKERKERQWPINRASNPPRKSPVSLAHDDVAPTSLFNRRAWGAENFRPNAAKGLLQHYRHFSDVADRSDHVCCPAQRGSTSRARRGLKMTLAV
jgi:hypothetical protein